jgi:hypothetical protein
MLVIHGDADQVLPLDKTHLSLATGPRVDVCDEPSSPWGMTPSRSFTCRPRPGVIRGTTTDTTRPSIVNGVQRRPKERQGQAYRYPLTLRLVR